LKRCKHGKVNPRTTKGAVDAMAFGGFQYVCNLDGMRDKAIKSLNKEQGNVK
jgi:hypothetical protein